MEYNGQENCGGRELFIGQATVFLPDLTLQIDHFVWEILGV